MLLLPALTGYPSAAIAVATVSYGGYLSDDDGDDIAFAAASPAPSSVFEREPEADSRDSGVDSNDARRMGRGPMCVVGPTEFTMPLAPAPRKISALRDADHFKMAVDDGFEDMDRMVMDEETVNLTPSERSAADMMLRRPPIIVNIVKSTPPIRFGLRDVTNSTLSTHHESPKSSKFPFINQRKMGMSGAKPGAIFGQTRKRAKLPSPPASLTTTPSAPEGKKRKHSVASSSPMQMETLKVATDEHPLFMRSMSASVLEGVERESAEHMELRMQQKQVNYHLPTVSNPQIPSAAFKSISGQTLASLISSMSSEEFNRKYFLVDCRFPYEYNGGHIRHATNIYDVGKVQSVFFPDEDPNGGRRPERQSEFLYMRSRIPIFYCEFSQKRGPTMAQAVRHHDRARNEDRYPDLDYEEIYVLDRGYRKFFTEDKLMEYCDPCEYVQMREKDHQNQLKMFTKSKSFSGSASGRPGLMSRSTKKLSFRPFVDSPTSHR
uniref:M-phase inducer phosphatase n=1 Tax=Plectus sambesii TaxID=2011161 RepID=A0A914WT62_9BILA